MISSEKARKAYQLIEQKANSSMLVEGLSGIGGFPWTVIADGAIIFTHYQPMVSEIRHIFDRSDISVDDYIKAVKALKSDILMDFALDQICGQIPILGIYFNLICAKAMTWRIGLVLAIASSRGEELCFENLHDAMKLSCQLAPRNGISKLAQPAYEDFEKIINSVADQPVWVYSEMLSRAISLLVSGQKVRSIQFDDLKSI